MRLHGLLDGLGVPLELRGQPDVDVRSVVHDSREAAPGALFCCIRGAVTNGHAHAAAAVAAGAIALLVEDWVAVDVTQARVTSVRAVLGPLAARFYGEPSRSMRVLGVTGTNGKTTTTYLLESIARAAGERTGVIGTVSARVGDAALPIRHTTPEGTDLQALLARMRDAAVTTVAIEVSSHALDQHRVDGTRFAAACFTNLSHEHLDYHGTFDAYCAAKARLFTPAFTDRAAICIDDDAGRALHRQAVQRRLRVRTFGVDAPSADVTAVDIAIASDSTVFTLVDADTNVRVRTGLLGSFNVANALAAATTARIAGFDLDAVVAGLEADIVVPGRMERVDAGQPFTVLVDYAHTPDALERVLDASRGLTAGAGGRVLVVFGCGGDRDRTKRPLMGAIASRLSDVAILTSDNPRSEDPAAIAADVVAGVPGHAPRLALELDRRAAIRAALGRARAGDVVVIAGKGHEAGQTSRGVTVAFDDRVVTREELEARACR